MGTDSALRRLSLLNPGTEIWWDSSPLVFDAWCKAQQALWRDQPTLSGALQELNWGALSGVLRGCTTNPPLALEALCTDLPRWRAWARAQQRDARDGLAWDLYRSILRAGAQRALPLWEQSDGRFGQICGQVDPRLLHDAAAMVQQGIALHAECPNVMVKLPATQAGIEGIRLLTARGISTNATLGFSVAQILATAEAARTGFELARAAGVDLSTTRSMATLMLGRLEDAPAFDASATSVGLSLSELERRWAGVAVARQAYGLLCERGMQTKLLLASMRLGPTVEGTTRIWHLEQLAGGNTVLTIFPNILAAYMQAYADRPIVATINEPVPSAVLERLQQIPYFVQAYEAQGAAPDEFDGLPGLMATASSFTEAMSSFEETAAQLLSE
ncbi:MAG: hypothetical protein GXY79_11825 [Chloroflexi bacterium]|jgi:transaldolase|nr:hypothetical protein [Chloroflexota bacterium]